MFKVGDKIRGTKENGNNSDFLNPDIGTIIDISNDIIRFVCPALSKRNMTKEDCKWYIRDKFVVLAERNKTTTTPTIKEIDCRVCSKKNDIGINSCWWCGNNPV